MKASTHGALVGKEIPAVLASESDRTGAPVMKWCVGGYVGAVADCHVRSVCTKRRGQQGQHL
jgi:hypothetical protein